MNNFDYKNMTPFKWFVLENFPFIENDFEAINNYRLFSKVVEYLNSVIDDMNSVGQQTENITNAMTQLQNYVNNYFENLDVQEEINIKLDEMATDGTLTNLIKNYIDPIQNEFENSINQRINAIGDGSPLVATSTAEMTDTNKIYVNTSNGKWYYYNGSSWTVGGTYQSTGIEENSVIPEMTKMWQRNNLVPKFNWKTGKVYNINSGNLQTFTGSYNEEFIDIHENTILCPIYNEKSTMRIYFYDSDYNYISNSAIQLNVTKLNIPTNAYYCRFALWSEEYTEMPDGKIELYTLTDYNLAEKSYEIKDFFYPDSKEIKIIDAKFKMTGRGYGLTDAGDSLNSYSQNKINYTVNVPSNTRYVGFRFFADFKVGDVLKIYGGVNSTYSLYPSENNNYSLISVDKTNYKEIIIDEQILNEIEDIKEYKITSGYTSTATENITITVNDTPITLQELFEKYTKIENQKTINALVLGDSITRLGGDRSWLNYFNQIQPINIIQNVAVNGATLMDKQNTIYDGNPVFDGADNNENNVLGNQVQKILNNNYTEPDIIIIAIGTNGGIDTTFEDIYNSYYDSNNNLIPLNSLDRKTVAGAFRYCNETLKNKYPNAKIFWCSPIYSANIISKPISRVNSWSDNLEKMCLCGGVQFIDTMNCGITPVTEIVGENGLYLLDGLHPNSNGARCMGHYNARAMSIWLKYL